MLYFMISYTDESWLPIKKKIEKMELNAKSYKMSKLGYCRINRLLT